MPLVDPLTSISSALKRAQIIPDVLPDDFSPSALFSIAFPSGKAVALGEEIAREDTLEPPVIQLTPTVAHAEAVTSTGELSGGSKAPSYTIAMLDPDAPSRADPKFKEFRHWLITGLQLPAQHVSETGNFNALETRPATTPYRPPGPPPGSGLHRYIFLLFEEPSSGPLVIPPDAPEHGAALEERRSWNVLEFARKYGLTLVGANFFLVRSAPAPSS
ncbi:hypothetical protein PLICRDRAFT_114452 [Plicaturopsis crispa FD-325 SS-3]|nr:hypothetical protein PLICRDRAFT_114452 [Plicaturopsis crispa FD-325 SS-3]